MDSKSTRGSGWQHIRTSEDETYVMIFDVYILYENSGRKSTGSDWKSERNQDCKVRLKNFSVSKAALNKGICSSRSCSLVAQTGDVLVLEAM